MSKDAALLACVALFSSAAVAAWLFVQYAPVSGPLH
jgi:hypothetical protein